MTERRKVTAMDLVDYAYQLNRMNFSKVMGWHWFVAVRDMPNGSRQHFLDRRDVRAEANRLPPEQTSFADVRRPREPAA